MQPAFPAAELKPLRNIEKSWAEGWYKPYCLFDGDNIVGEAFLWLGHPGWALLDYLFFKDNIFGVRNGIQYTPSADDHILAWDFTF